MFLMLVIGLSRVYLGVHFPTDVLGGWAVGAVVLGAAAWALQRLAPRDLPAREPAVGPAARRATAAGVADGGQAGACSSALLRWLPWWAWIPAAGLLAGAVLVFLPEKDSVAMVAGMWGFVTGHLLRRRYFPGGEEGTAAQRLLRLPAGLAVLLVLYLGLKSLFPGEGQALYLPLRFVRYLLAGAWASLGAPLLFRCIGLARRPPSRPGSWI